MPRADSPTNAIKEDVQEVREETAEDTLKRVPETQDLHGSGADDKFDNSPNRHGLEARNREKDGSKVPEAMGAGE